MALEDAVQRLTAAIERNQQGAAVAEIIRQRDFFQKDAEQKERKAQTYYGWYLDGQKENHRLGRVIGSLRGVITRMKRQSAALKGGN